MAAAIMFATARMPHGVVNAADNVFRFIFRGNQKQRECRAAFAVFFTVFFTSQNSRSADKLAFVKVRISRVVFMRSLTLKSDFVVVHVLGSAQVKELRTV